MSLRSFFKRFGSRDHAAPLFQGEGEVGAVIEALRPIVDPELGVSVVELGLLRAVEVADGQARITMTLTTAGCPLIGVIQSQVEGAVQGLGLEASVTMTFDPPWSPEDMSESGRAALG